MAAEKRRYRKTRRAESEALTVRRITESAVALHGTVGPARTTVSAVAKHAGVRRATVYRHFPDEAALFAACSAHWVAANPTPDLGRWAAFSDPDERLRFALADLYAYYRSGAQMLENLFRDEAMVPVLQNLLGVYRQYIAAAAGILLEGRIADGDGRRPIAAAVGHALAFSTWQSLTRDQGLDDHAAVGLMCRLVAAAAGGPATTAAAVPA